MITKCGILTARLVLHVVKSKYRYTKLSSLHVWSCRVQWSGKTIEHSMTGATGCPS